MDQGLDAIKQWAILPVKPFKQAKTRLSAVLSPEEREALAITLFQRSVGLLTSIRQFAGVLVVSRDPEALKMARLCGAQTLTETGQPELNHALRRASEVVMGLGATGIFIMPVDLPFVTAQDIEQMLYMGRFRKTAVIAPDGKRDGTNSMYLTPPNLIPLSYGEGSFARHMALAEGAGARALVYESPRLSLDIDTPADLDVYYAAQRIHQQMIQQKAAQISHVQP
jgi:2-phospho-L-lactate/phosphoenolpyruvate guanylyltransferase